MNLLAIETATSVCGIAIFINGSFVAIVEEELHRQHAKKLPEFFDKLLTETNIKISDIDGIAVSIGPGSFTGLRIGLSYGKGLAFSAGLPVIPVPTLQTLVEGSQYQHENMRCIIHSHRDFVYYQDFSFYNDNYDIKSQPKSGLWKDVVYSLEEYQVIYQYGCQQLIDQLDTKTGIFKVKPSALSVGKIALRVFERDKIIEYHKIEPEYVSDFIISKKIGA